MEAVGNRLGLGWVRVKRASSWSWRWVTELLYCLSSVQTHTEGKCTRKSLIDCLRQAAPRWGGTRSFLAQPVQVLQVLAEKWLHLAQKGVSEETTAGTWF